jgi:peptidoglycan hydrolase-like protein with peptidoglycan-binding domain
VTLLAMARFDDGTAAGEDDAVVELTTVPAEERDLLTYSTISGTLGYESTLTLATPRDGTVTAVAEVGTVLERGSILIEIDREPTVVFGGVVPLWRDLEDGVEDGTDVRQLEENLAALGFIDEGRLIIDQEFDQYTESAVEAWQEGLGLEADGVVEIADVVVLPGPAEVGQSMLSVGGSAHAGADLFTVTVLASEQDIVHRVDADLDSVITTIPALGDPVDDGSVLYAVDRRPVVVFVEPETAPLVTFDRDLTLGVDDGDDVVLLEERMVALGFDAAGALVVDRRYDEATASALADWQTSIGVVPDEDPVLRRGDVVVVRGERTVAAVHAGLEETVSMGTVVVTVGRSVRVVTGQLPVGDLDLLEVGQSVEVELPDDTVLEGAVREVGTVAVTVQGSGAVVDYSVEIVEGGEQTSLVVAPVTVRVLEEAVLGAVAVPVPALLVLAEGGYAVEIVDGSGTRLVAVELGAYADSWVEITAGSIEPGDEVVVAR